MAKPAETAELTDSERGQIIDQAEGWIGTKYKLGGNTEEGIDCSNLVHRAYQEAGFDYGYTMTTSDWGKAGFKETTDPKPGDLILWEPLSGKEHGHIGIVLDAETKTFIGAQKSTGVAEESYDQNKYWGKRPYIFLRYEKPSVTQ
ncbi:MAG: C40 family peptidase [Deltaproteobacteria bacterium]|nr:C40 family peptidase [Deltaproteobacteria bacterium]